MIIQKRELLFGFIWSIIGQFGYMAVSLIANVILARLLTPYEFGQVGIIMFFITIGLVFAESGLGGALIRKKEVTRDDYATVFFFNLAVSVACFIVVFAISGLISTYYKDSALQNLLIAASFTFIINAFNITQNAKLVRDMDFKTRSTFKFASVVLSSVIGIFLAYNGFGVWSLVIMQILTIFINTVLLVIRGGFFFSLKFNADSFKSMYSFGVNTTLASLLNTAFDNVYQLVLGRYFSIGQVGLFYQAKKLQEVPNNVIQMTTLNVVFSFLSKLQDDKQKFGLIYNKLILIFTVIMGLVTTLIFLYSKELILLLYGKEWKGAEFFMKLLCIASFFYMQEMFNRVIFKVFNETRKILFLEILKKSIQTVSIIVGILSLDLKVLLIGFVFTSICSYLINFYFSRKILGNVAWYEIIILGKVLMTCGIGVCLFHFISQKLNIKGLETLYIAPFFIILYLYTIQTLKIVNFITEFKSLKKILVNKQE